MPMAAPEQGGRDRNACDGDCPHFLMNFRGQHKSELKFTHNSLLFRFFLLFGYCWKTFLKTSSVWLGHFCRPLHMLDGSSVKWNLECEMQHCFSSRERTEGKSAHVWELKNVRRVECSNISFLVLFMLLLWTLLAPSLVKSFVLPVGAS